jgi:hypothetical protein
VSELSDALAQIAELQGQLTAAQAEAARVGTELSVASTNLTAAQTQSELVPGLQARVAELEKLMAPPPPGSAILTVNYSDGRVKYAASDGNKYLTVVEAQHHMIVLALMQTGMTETQAESVLMHQSDIVKALT